MRKPSALAGSFAFFVLAPGTIAGLVPWLISGYRLPPVTASWWFVCSLGVLFVANGLALLFDCFIRFALQGLGTPAPVAPPEHLVASGPYRYVRNPMYVAVLALIIGQGLIFETVALFAYGLAVWLCFTAFVLGYEEPTLRKQFGEQYDAYCKRVPRWIPRLRRS
jgi:protein-S-isoprenylcysteine O-methyltransferase Ste14